MSLDSITPLVLEYRYWILIPLTFIEGPIVAFIAGTLASLGYFNIWGLAALFFVRDILMDLVCYYLGQWGWRLGFVKRMVAKVGVTHEHVQDVRKLWFDHGFKTMFFSKISYGIAAAFVMVAGMVELPLLRFLRYGVIVTILQYGVLLVLGYFLGNAFGGTIKGILESIQYVLIIVAVAGVGYFYIKRYMRKRILEEERKALQQGDTSH